jgi:uncharacterized protein YrrD
MKKIQDIIGLPLISIEGAMELGDIRDVLIDPDSCKVRYLLVLDKKWYLGAIVIPFEDILSIGTDAVTIENQKVCRRFSEVEDALRLAEKEIEVSQARVFTERGQYIGEVKEFYMGLEDGVISKCHLDGPRGPVIIEHPRIISFGPKTLVFQEGKQEEKEPVSNEPRPKSTKNSVPSSVRLFEEKQRQFLIGRKGTRTVLDSSGNVLLEEGQVLTNEILDKVKDKNKIMELTINTR